MTTNNLIAGHAQSLKKAWSLVFNGVVWAEFKLLAGMALIISLGPGSCAGKVGAYERSEFSNYFLRKWCGEEATL